MPSPCTYTLLPRAQTAEFEISLTSIDYDDDFASEALCTASSANAELARYEAFLQREFPSSIRQELETRVDDCGGESDTPADNSGAWTWANSFPGFDGTMYQMTLGDNISFDLGESVMLVGDSFENFSSRSNSQVK